MLRDLSQVLTFLDGSPIPGPDTDEKGQPKPMTLQDACIQALLGTYADEERLPGKDKVARFELSRRIYAATTVDLKSEEIAKIKELIGKAFTVLVVGQAWELLEQEPKLVEKVIDA